VLSAERRNLKKCNLRHVNPTGSVDGLSTGLRPDLVVPNVTPRNSTAPIPEASRNEQRARCGGDTLSVIPNVVFVFVFVSGGAGTRMWTHGLRRSVGQRARSGSDITPLDTQTMHDRIRTGDGTIWRPWNPSSDNETLQRTHEYIYTIGRSGTFWPLQSRLEPIAPRHPVRTDCVAAARGADQQFKDRRPVDRPASMRVRISGLL